MNYPHNGYPPPIPLHPHQRRQNAGGSADTPPEISGQQPVPNAPDVPTPQHAVPNGPAPIANAEAVERLRRHLRDTLAAQLPQRVEAQQRRTGVTVSGDDRRELARSILDEAIRAHSETELMADRGLLGREV